MSRELVHLKQYRHRLVDRYGSQPQLLRAKIEACEGEALKTPLGDGEWTPHQVLAHVMATEKFAFTPRIRGIQDAVDPIFENFDASTWMETQYQTEETIETYLDDIEQARSSAQATLDPEHSAQWNRTGTHSYRGVRTLQWWVEYAAAHVDDHLRQLGGA